MNHYGRISIAIVAGSLIAAVLWAILSPGDKNTNLSQSGNSQSTSAFMQATGVDSDQDRNAKVVLRGTWRLAKSTSSELVTVARFDETCYYLFQKNVSGGEELVERGIYNLTENGIILLPESESRNQKRLDLVGNGRFVLYASDRVSEFEKIS